MAAGRLWRELRRGLRRRGAYSGYRTPAPRRWRRGSGPPAWLLTIILALLMAAAVIGALEARLRPMVETIARAAAVNSFTGVVDGAIAADLTHRGVDYGDFVTIQRDSAGAITALSTNMAAMNLLRAELITKILYALSEVDVSTLRIPLGALVDSELLWARGPAIQVRSMSVGTVSAEFESEFSTAGINQTLHRIYLEVHVPLTLMLPGGEVETGLETRLCVAETVIVGAVPDAFLQWPGQGS